MTIPPAGAETSREGPSRGGRAWAPPISRRTRIGEAELHSLEFGAGERALVLLHGLSGSARWWDRTVGELAGRYRVLVPELLGFGHSRASGPVPPLDEMADVLAEWMARVSLERVDLVGHSMGGQVSIHLAARHPERLERLVLVDSAGIPRPFTPAEAFRLLMEAAPLWRWGDPRFVPTIVHDAWRAGPRTMVTAILHILRDDVRPLLSRIRTPTLVLWGEHDGLVPLSHGQQIREAIPGAEMVVLRGAGHNPMIDRPADFNRLLMRFLDGERVGR